MPKGIIYDVIIIGAGPVGLFGAHYANIKGLKTCLIEQETNVGGQPQTLYPQKPIYDFPAINKISGENLINLLYKQFVSFKDHNLRTNTKITRISQTSKKIVVFTNYGNFNTKKIIIATGVGSIVPNKLTINGVSECKNIDYHIRDLKKYRNKKIVVLGGGDSAVDIANQLVTSKITNDVTILYRGSKFRATGTNIHKLKNNKIKTVFLVDLIGVNRNKLSYKTTNKNCSIDFDYIIVQYGLAINNSISTLFPKLRLKNDAILVNKDFSTNIQNIYAAGDCCMYHNKIKRIISGISEITLIINSILFKKKN
jgi:thioredoxin reductase (NADPH)